MQNRIIIDQTRPDQTRPDQTRPDHDHPVVRNSSLELLRIVAMIMIVGHHIYRHGKFDFPVNVITVNKLWTQFLLIGGGLGNCIFVFISGYFLVKSSGVKYRKLFNLWVRAFFYAVLIYWLFVLYGLEAFSPITALRVMLPVTRPRNWFIATYFVMYLVHPYVNILLRSFTRDEYRKFLVSVFIFWCAVPVLTNSNFQGNALTEFICIYSLAGYVRLWADDFGSRKYIIFGAMFALANFLLVVLVDLAALHNAFFERYTEYFLGMMRPFTVLASMCLFLGFKHLNISSRAVNIVASATLGVYLLHENEFIRENFLWQDIFHMAQLRNSPYLIPYSLFALVIVYIACTVIELLRSKIFRTLTHGYLS